MLLAFLLTAGVLGSATIANADTVNELTASWDNRPASLKNGSSTLLTVKVNANDDKGAAGLQKNLTPTVRLVNGAIDAIPQACQASGSSISADGTTLTCNLGDVDLGTAKSFKVGATVSGTNNSQLSAAVSLPGADTVDLDPIRIVATPGLDVVFNDSSMFSRATTRTSHPAVNLPFAITAPVGSERLKGTVSFRITATDTIGAMSTLMSFDSMNFTGISAPGWPATPKNYPDANKDVKVSVVKTTNGTKVAWTVTVTGLDTTLSDLPGNATWPDRNIFLVGYLKFATTGTLYSSNSNVANYNTVATSFVAGKTSATTVTGSAATEVTTNNQTETRNIPIGNGQSANWMFGTGFGRSWSALAGQGAPWQNDGHVLPGDVIDWQSQSTYRMSQDTADTGFGICDIMDTSRARLATTRLYDDSEGGTLPYIDLFADTKDPSTPNAAGGPTVEGYIGSRVSGEWNLKRATCGGATSSTTTSGWVPIGKIAAADVNKVTSVRMYWTKAQQAKQDRRRAMLNLPVAVQDAGGNAAPGTSIWGVTTFAMTPGTGPGGLTWLSHNNASNAGDRNSQGTAADGGTLTTTSDAVRYADHRVSAAVSAQKATVNAGDTTVLDLSGIYAANPAGEGDLKLTLTLPAGLAYVSAGTRPDAAQTSNGVTTLVWTKRHTESGTAPMTVTVRATRSGSFTPKLTVTNAGSASTQDKTLDTASASTTVSAQDRSATVLSKTATSSTFAPVSANTWKLFLANQDATRTQDVYDIVDILPYNGDGRGTKFSGTYAIGDVAVPSGATAYYTAADPKTLRGDPADASNGSFGSVNGNTVGWSTTRPSGTITGIRIIGSELTPVDTAEATIGFTTSGNAVGDTYDNIAYSRATLTELQMIRSEKVTTVVDGSALQIDKIVDGGQTLTAGKPHTYTLTVKNSGTGTARGVVVDDTLGANLVAGSWSWSDPSQGSASQGRWNVGDLAPGATATIKVTATVAADPTGHTVNSAKVWNPSNPPKSTCEPNDGVDADTDQCDSVDEPPTMARITLVKKVVNTHGGQLAPKNWDNKLHAAGQDFTSGQTRVVAAGKVALSEDQNPGYARTDLSCAADGKSLAVSDDAVNVAAGTQVTCTFTNADQPGAITWGKADGSGRALAGSSWTLSGPDGAKVTVADNSRADADARTGHFKAAGLAWGTWTLTETKAPAGYTVDTTIHTVVVDGSHLSVDAGTFADAQHSRVVLPLTGGRSAVLFAVLGILLAVAAATVVIINRRKNA
jgi:uncharacterized repeat protein (TIGR01451 family)/LPXTG-motif cell wall-anchored protein